MTRLTMLTSLLGIYGLNQRSFVSVHMTTTYSTAAEEELMDICRTSVCEKLPSLSISSFGRFDNNRLDMHPHSRPHSRL